MATSTATLFEMPHEKPFSSVESKKSRRKVSEALPDKVLKKLAEIPPAYRQTYKRAMTGKSLRAATTAFCQECCGYQREEIKLCTAIDCPLYPYRPYEK
jgi:hypothetical protein